MEGRMAAMESSMEELKMTMRAMTLESQRASGRRSRNQNPMESSMEELKVTMQAMTLEFQRASRRCSRNQNRSSAGSRDFVNAERERLLSESSEEESEYDRVEVQRSWMKRVELPTFEGIDPTGWITKAEKFFDIQGVTEKEKMKLVYICMEGGANDWFRFWRKKIRHPTWKLFTKALTRRFGGLNRGTKGSVDEYIQEFELLVAQAAGVEGGTAKSGEPHNPHDLLTAMERARDVEKWRNRRKRTSDMGKLLPELKDRSENGNLSRVVGRVCECRRRARGEDRGAGSSGGGNAQGRGVRALPYPKYIKRREEGRCFHCGDPYRPGHRCAERSLRVMILAEDDENEVENIPDLEQKNMELSLFAARGLTPSNMMKLQGWVQGRRGELTMRFELEEKEVEIQGDPTLTDKVVTPEALLKEREIQTMPLVWGLSQAEMTEGDWETERMAPVQEVRLQQILANFKGKFQEHQGLPPERKIYHRIPLKEDRLQIQINSVQFVRAMEVMYTKLHDKYTEVKTKKLSDWEHFNEEQQLKFLNGLSVAEEVIKQLKIEKEELLGQINNLRVKLALLKATKDNQLADYQMLLRKESHQNETFFEEVEKLQQLCQEGAYHDLNNSRRIVADEARFISFESDQVNSVERESMHNAYKEITFGILLECGSEAKETGYGEVLISVLFEYAMGMKIHLLSNWTDMPFCTTSINATSKEPITEKGGDIPSFNTEQEDGLDFNLEDKVDVEGEGNGRRNERGGSNGNVEGRVERLKGRTVMLKAEWKVANTEQLNSGNVDWTSWPVEEGRLPWDRLLVISPTGIPKLALPHTKSP
ncbi:hypothetical protein V8G54_022350 [Vigna mungo]|uniref:Retrotransposon gag domain-containing protein n=1 Tax=Vigna mungo TaxID=3915 RepID=A0AAQ3RY85_VIGMU